MTETGIIDLAALMGLTYLENKRDFCCQAMHEKLSKLVAKTIILNKLKWFLNSLHAEGRAVKQKKATVEGN